MRTVTALVSGVLTTLAALHMSWGMGSSFPFRSRRELADVVVGASTVPGPTACLGVAGALATGELLLMNALPVNGTTRRFMLRGMGTIFGVRSALGFTGTTTLISPASDSERFVRLDRRIYAPT